MNAQACEEVLSAHGIRPTVNRIVVLKELSAAGRPMSMSELEKRILSIDKSGIFRALCVFRESHLVHVLEDGGDGVRYELCHSSRQDEDDDMHAHFYCENCRQTFCLEDICVPQVSLPEGYEVSSVNYMIKGMCPDCVKRGCKGRAVK